MISGAIEQKESINKFYLATLSFIAAIGGFLFGFDTAVISGTLHFVQAQFAMSPTMEGWFVSSALLGAIIGVAFAGKLSDSAGRKNVLLLSALLFLISGIGCGFAPDQSWLITYRFIGGMGVGVASIISPLYISEFAPAKYRGSLVSVYQLAITIGILVAYFSNAMLLKLSTGHLFANSLLHWIINLEVWRVMFVMYAFPAIIFFLLLLIVPESPRWLAMKGKNDKAFLYLSKLNGPISAKRELEEIKEAAKEETGSLRMLLEPKYRVPLIIGLSLPILSQFSGINAIIYYGPKILEQAGFQLSGALGGQVTIGLINVFFTIIAVFMIDKWGRKPLLIAGISGAIVSLAVCGILFAKGITDGPWILISILAYISCFAFSFGPICWVIIGEIYPNSIRGRAMSVATLTLWIGVFIVGWLTPIMLNGIGAAFTFWIFALLCIPALFITLKIIPETKGKSLEEIERHWNK